MNPKICVPLLLLASLFGCGGQPTDIKAKEYKGHFEDKNDGLFFSCNTTWEVRENIQGQRVIARSPREGANDPFQENLVISGPYAGETEAEARATAQAQLAKLPGFALKGEDPLDFVHQQQKLNLRCQAAFIKNPKGGYWMATFTSTDVHFPAKVAEWDKIRATMSGQKTAAPATPVVASPTPAVKLTATPAATPKASATPAVVPTATPKVSAPVTKPTATPAALTATPKATAPVTKPIATPAVMTATPKAK